MSLHINKFIDKIKAVESRRQGDVVLTINEARDLHADITKLLLILQTLQDQKTTNASDVVTVELTGGSF
jgi:hypothetical protein